MELINSYFLAYDIIICNDFYVCLIEWLTVVSIERFFTSIFGPSIDEYIEPSEQEQPNANIKGEDDHEIGAGGPIEEEIIEGSDDLIREFNQEEHIISDPGLHIPIERFHPNIRDQVILFVEGSNAS